MHFQKLLKNKKQFRNYIIIGLVNTVFGYFSGVTLFNIFYDSQGVVFVGLVSSAVNVTFSYINYKIFLFNDSKNWLYQYFKYCISNIFLMIFSIALLYLFVDIFYWSIYLSQFFLIVVAVIVSYFVNVNIVFNKKIYSIRS